MIFVPYTEEDIDIANSYLSVADADDIILKQQNNEEWNGLSEQEKQVLLIQSSLSVDGAMSYQGTRTSPAQTLRFPVDGNYVLPRNITFATALIAMGISNDETFKNIKREKESKHEIEYFQNAELVSNDILVFLKPLRQTTLKIAGIEYE